MLTAGARLQSIDIERFSYFGGGLNTAYDEEAITPVVGLVVKPVEGLSLYANYIEALQEGAVAPLGPAIANPGEVLVPRMSTQYEVGGKIYFDPSIFATLAFYRIERPGEGFEDDGAGGTRFAYVGEQRNRGIELTLNSRRASGSSLVLPLPTPSSTTDWMRRASPNLPPTRMWSGTCLSFPTSP